MQKSLAQLHACAGGMGEKKFLLCSHSLTILHEEQVCVSHLLSASNCSASSGEVWRRPEQT